ncbi:hypothetical protein BH10PLA1_BH10PLA1_07410 [soil metagenome]
MHQQNHTTRFAVIIAVLIIALYMIFPQPQKLFDPNLRLWEKTNLKPGLDMVGGTSLTYEIHPAAGSVASADLAVKTMEALKKRIDPTGTRNLVWRPQGATRLEIQMPLSDYSGSGKKIRQAFSDAQHALEATNVRTAEIINTIETLKGDAREDRLKQMAGDSTSRASLYGALRGAFDQIQDAKAKNDLDKAAQAEITYEDLQKQLGTDNLSSADLETDLALSEQGRAEKLSELKKKFADFPARIKAIDNFVVAYDAYGKVKGTLDDSADLKRLLKGSGVLEFHILVQDDSSDHAAIEAMRERLKTEGPLLKTGDQMRWFRFDRDSDARGSGVVEKYNEKMWGLAWITPDQSMVNKDGQEHWALESAYQTSDGMGGRAVGFRFDLVGARFFSHLTRKENVDQHALLSVMLDDKIISSATLQATISREGQITRGDGYSNEDLNYLINTLSAGSLPAQLADEPISEQTVGPQLGLDNLRDGLFACALGLVIVGIFLVFYYHIAGVVAFIAVAMNVVIILGVMAMFGATFTLPGVAGIVLTIGAAVDANVLIFERLREEQERGLSLKLALQHAYDRALSAIIDSNATTVITSLVLIWLSSEEVKGFGITLLIGLIASLFTSLFVTKTIFGVLVQKFNLSKLGSFPQMVPAWNRLLHPKIDWMGKAWMFITGGTIFILIGCAAFVYQFSQGRLLDIEFASGTGVQFELKEKTNVGDVRKMVENNPALPAPSVVSVGSDEKVYEVVTPNNDAKAVKDAILTTFGDKLTITLPSEFDLANKPFDEAYKSAVVPITGDFNVDGFKPAKAATYRGGAAIVLRNLSPKLLPKEVDKRIRDQQQTQTSGKDVAASSDFVVESPHSADTPSDTIIVLVSDPNFTFDKGEGSWRENLAGPNWRLVNDAITKSAQLQKVSNFNPSVAGDAQRDALMALVMSVILIMAYIWLRFGNLKYGTATVVAMLHDTLLVIGAVGFTHVVAGTAIGSMLLIQEGFRINLTLVASILTVMSYSMIDTIVVFDRIRENRGKYGHLSRKVINDSINQTMSRTLLTAGTTVVTLLGMYIAGGPGIHGFTFVLLIGILVGTYSSIVIAAPILLVGADKEKQPASKQPPAGQLSKVGG